MSLLTVLLALLAIAFVPTASASEIIDRNATGITLKVNAKGEALISYRSRGIKKNVLVWGAVNAKPPTAGSSQVAFRKDYAAGWGKYRQNLSLPGAFKNSCGRYDGPALPWFVTACKAPDGSYWALQSWQRMLPNLGYAPWKAEQSVWELRLSHWKGELPKLEIWTDWVYSSRFHHLFGRLTYQGVPQYGFKSSGSGAPLDNWGRNIYLDVYNPVNYGIKGWTRENSFLAHTGTGVFCYGFYPHKPYSGYPNQGVERPQGWGERYRATVIGPGVLPDVMWEGADPGVFDKLNPANLLLETQMNDLQRSFSDPLCKQN